MTRETVTTERTNYGQTYRVKTAHNSGATRWDFPNAHDAEAHFLAKRNGGRLAGVVQGVIAVLGSNYAVEQIVNAPDTGGRIAGVVFLAAALGAAKDTFQSFRRAGQVSHVLNHIPKS